MKQYKHRVLNTLTLRRKTAVRLALIALISQFAQAQSQTMGINIQGNTGGLVIPYADVLDPGTLAFTYGNYQEPQLGAPRSTQQNLSFGVGVLPNVEFFGRFAEYTDPQPIFFTGARDISANLKVQLPMPWKSGPKVAVGVNDLSGGAVFFKSAYAVASHDYGPLKMALGIAKGQAPLNNTNQAPTFDGIFGGINVRLTDNGLSGLAEYDGQQKHLGLRWMSSPIVALGHAQVVGNVQRSFGAYDGIGSNTQKNHVALSLIVPLGNNEQNVANFQPSPSQALAALDALPGDPATPGMQATAQDRLESLRKALMAVGLERVRVGLHGPTLVVEYENHRYAHNEVDALGLVFGLGAEMAPRGTTRINAVTFKDGLRLYETAVGLNAFRSFLRDGPASRVRDSLSWERKPSDMSGQTEWLGAKPGPASPVRLEVKPDFNYTLGTEVGAFDYALAANVQATAPLWSGARVYASYLAPLANSSNMDKGSVFAIYKQRRGLKTTALQQSFWLGSQVLASVSAGRFHYDTLGVQAEAVLFLPGTDNQLRVSGAGYDKVPGGLAGGDRAFAASYRHMLSPTMWVEAGAQRYSDGSTGPSLEWNRWYGDVGVQIFYRKGGSNQFAGLQLNFPLTPRQGMAPGPVFFTGAGHYEQRVRTALTTAGSPGNYVRPGAVTNLKLETALEDQSLNAGRLSKDYFHEQVYRMREAFFMYARDQLMSK